ncbi:mRNA cap guanine-N7 methyltransferase [Smittium culicis]|uniref:mRNA cap guanine-N(7) methyltransferase n=1 Tax=Smittium culicis TaxID=133412 RepID=A0A1R1YRA5_9FUNG|nr:mRNA cap guanine-N7 methyltransferase [Smittium culicis]
MYANTFPFRNTEGVFFKPNSMSKSEHDVSSKAIVASHYNSIPTVNLELRKQSAIIKLKSFNNWVKSVLIASYATRGDKILDIACGKGGDLRKYLTGGVKEVVGLGIL